MDRFDPCGTDECKKRCDSYGVACDDIMADEIDRLRAELTELRKPDCFRCAYWFACRTLIKDDCGGGDKFVPKRDPVRLYEIDAAMAGGE